MFHFQLDLQYKMTRSWNEHDMNIIEPHSVWFIFIHSIHLIEKCIETGYLYPVYLGHLRQIIRGVHKASLSTLTMVKQSSGDAYKNKVSSIKRSKRLWLHSLTYINDKAFKFLNCVPNSRMDLSFCRFTSSEAILFVLIVHCVCCGNAKIVCFVGKFQCL